MGDHHHYDVLLYPSITIEKQGSCGMTLRIFVSTAFANDDLLHRRQRIVFLFQCKLELRQNTYLFGRHPAWTKAAAQGSAGGLYGPQGQ